MKKIVKAAIDLYRNTISPFVGNHCRFNPTCSEFTREAVDRYGAMKGLRLGAFRIMRCNTLFRGGYDPVPTAGVNDDAAGRGSVREKI